MKTSATALTILLITLAFCHALTPAQEIAALKAEYAKREEAAMRPIKDWYALELAKKEKAFMAAGNSIAAVEMAKERIVMLVCSVPAWSWEAKGYGDQELVFRPDGTGKNSHASFRWECTPDGVIMTVSDGHTSPLVLDAKLLKMTGIDYDKKTKVVCRPLAKASP